MDSNKITNHMRHDDNFRFETGLGPATDRILNSILDKFATDNFKEKLTDKIVDPIAEIINQKIKPYVYISLGLYGIIVILLLLLIYITIKKNKQ